MTYSTNRIAFQGEFGANSDMACRDMFPALEPLPCPTFEDAFNALAQGEADLAMIPIENTIAQPGRGYSPSVARIAAPHHWRILHADPFPAYGPAGHQALGYQDSAQPCPRAGAVPQDRSRQWLEGHRCCSDTAGAAKLVSNSGDKTMAAFAPKLAADLYGLDILAENVEDTETNVTRFVVLSRDAKTPPRPVADEVVVTTFVFRVRNIPAALYKAMGGFATNGINMTKLESYQIGGKFFATQFYADIQGHPDEAPVARAMEELGFFSKELRILGVYPAHPFRLAQNGSHAEDAEG